MSVHGRMGHPIETDWCQRTSPFGLGLFPTMTGSSLPGANLTQPHVEEKDCEARPPHPLVLRSQEEALFSVALALDVLDPDLHELEYQDVSS